MAVQNDNTILNKGDLKAYHQKILPFLGGNYMMSTNVSDYYSTDEKVVGVWTNGKPIYQKTVFVNQNLAANAGYALTAITGIDEIVSHKYKMAWQSLTSGVERVIDDAWTDLTSGYTDIFLHNGNVELRNTFAMGLFWITVQYTKTADAAGSGVTTPGAYDINFPNTWKENTEIYFGNGLYGKRYTGTITPTTTLSVYQIDASFNNSWMIKNCGGWFSRGCALNACNTNLAYMLYATSGTLNIQAKDSTSSGSNYDIWITYTK